jgi:hypothetical protein
MRQKPYLFRHVERIPQLLKMRFLLKLKRELVSESNEKS